MTEIAPANSWAASVLSDLSPGEAEPCRLMMAAPGFRLLASLVVGVVLLAACFSAIALYASCLTAQPFVASMIAFGLLLGMLLAGETAADGLRGRGWAVPAELAQVLSPLKNFEAFAKGMLDSYNVICMLLLIAVFLILTIRRLGGTLRGDTE